MNKKIPLIIGLLVIYFGYKGFNLFYYNVNRITTQDFETFAQQFNIIDTINIKHKDIDRSIY